MANQVRAGCRPVSRNDVDHTFREADLRSELRDPHRSQGRRRVRFQHDSATSRQGRRQLPGRHHQRVVPRHDLADDADRLLQRIKQERTADWMRTAGNRRNRSCVEAEVLDRLRKLRLHRGDRLADVPRLELGEFLSIGVNRIRERVQESRPLVRRRLRPRSFERSAGGGHRVVHVLRPGHRRPRKRFAGRRLRQFADLARLRLDRLAVDEEAVFAFRGDRHQRRE